MNKFIDNIAQVKSFQASDARYKLVICLMSEDDLAEYPDAWDIGYEMADFIKQHRESEDIALEFAGECTHQAQKHTTCIPEIGRCLMIKNYGILFEPSLQFSIQSFIKRCSQNNVLVLLSTGMIEGNRLYLTTSESDYYINISDINYIAL